MLSLSRLPTIIILATLISSVNGITWRFSSASCADGNPFQNNNIKVTCQGSTHCELGDTAVVSGTLMARTSFSDSKVTMQACALGYYCPEEAVKSGGNVCDWLTHKNGKDCGTEGSYTVSYTEYIPSQDKIPSSLNWLVGSAVTVKVIVGEEEECSATADNAYRMSYSMLGMAIVALVGARACAKKRNSRDDDDDKEYIEMGVLVV